MAESSAESSAGADLRDSEEPQEEAPIAPGKRIGRYVILERLGSGGMGVVYAAEDPELDRRVALKLLLSESGTKAASRRTRLLREAQAMARLKHANVVGVLDVGVYFDRVFVAMEYLEGARTIDEWIEQDAPSWREILDSFLQAGEGLAAAHKAGLVHRDFKPGNALISRDGHVRVTDFGLARPLGAAESERSYMSLVGELDDALGAPLTKTGAAIGTPAYMAPEQHKQEAVDERADQFSFCVALFECLYGLAPFEGGDRRALADAVTRGRARQPPWDTKVPDYVWRVIRRGLIADVRERFASMEELLAALRSDPAHLYRRIALWSLAGLVVLGGSIVAAARLIPTETQCGDGPEQLSGVWDDRRRRELEDVFSAIDAGYAPEAWSRVERSLDDYAAAWSEAHHRLCLSTQEGAQSQAVLDSRLTCLEQRKRGFAAIVDVVATADTSSLAHAIGAVQRLPSLAACEGGDAAQADDRDPEVLARLGDAEAGIERARALAGMGRFDEAEIELRGALALADELDDARLASRAAFELGHLALEAGELERARTMLEKSFFAAQQSDPGQAVDAAAELATLVGVRLSNRTGGLEWIRHARAAMDRLGEDVQREATIQYAIAEIHYADGDFERARGHAAQGVALVEEGDAPDLALLASLINTQGKALAGEQRTEEALERYAKVRAIRERLYGANHPDVGRALNNLGEIERQLGRFDDALVHLHRATLVLERSLGPEHPAVSLPSMRLARVYEDRGEADEALRWADRAVALAEAGYGKDHVRTAVLRAERAELQLRLLGDDADVIGDLQAATVVLEAEYAEHPELPDALLALAQAQTRAGDTAGAIATLTRAWPDEDGTAAVPLDRAYHAFMRAQLEYDDGLDRARARSEAQRALDAFTTAGSKYAADARRVAEWLAAHPLEPDDEAPADTATE